MPAVMPGPCPACEAPTRAWRRAPDHEPDSGATHLLARCPECGTAVTDGPAPSFSEAHEAGAYAPGAPHGSGVAGPLLRAFDRRRLALLTAAGGVAPGPLLDVGAGRGRFVASARAAGWDARGIEPSGRSAAPLVDRVALEEANVVVASLGAITLWHVLEHVADPAAALAQLHGWLRPGGVLLVGVPNIESFQARVGGPRWFHLDLPRHRTHFSARGLERLLARTGFEVVHTDHVLLEHNPFGLWQSALNRVTPTQSWLFHALKRNAPLAAADTIPTGLALPLVPVAAGVELAAGLAGRGGTVAAAARRVE